MTFNHVDEARQIYPTCSNIVFGSSMFVRLTVQPVALYEGFIVLQIGARVRDVGPDVFIQVPGV